VRQSAAASVILGAVWLIAGLRAGWALPILTGGVSAGMVAAALVLLAAFHGESEVRDMKRRMREERRLRRAIAVLDREIERHERRRARLEAQFARRELRAQERIRRMREREGEDLALVRELERAHRAHAAAQAEQITRAEKEEVRSAIDALQRRYTRSRLRRCSIRTAPLPAAVKLRLWLTGARTAARIDADRMAVISRLDGRVAEAVAAWRVDAELEARKGAPTVLPAPALHRLTERFGRERVRLERHQERALASDRRVQDAIMQYWAGRRKPSEDSLARRRAALGNHCRDLDGAIADVRDRAEPLTAQLARARRDLEPYEELSFGRYLVRALPRRYSLHP
jgi:hypothetical protein